MKKSIVVVLLAVVMMLSLLVGCKGTETSTGTEASAGGGEELSFIYISPILANPYWDVVQAGVEDAAAALGAKVEVMGTNAVDINKMCEYMETAVAKGCDGILTMSLSASAFSPYIDKAKEAGIPVVLVDTDAPDSKRDCYIGTNNYQAGFALGEALIEMSGGKATIGIMSGVADQQNMIDREAGFKAAIKDQADMTVVTTEFDNSALDQCISKTEAMILAYPEINTLVGIEGYGVPGMGKVLKEKGLADSFICIGFDNVDETIAFIKEGIAEGTCVQRQYMMGYAGIEALVKINKGEKVEDIDSGVIILTKDNIDSYDPEAK
jgi:ribose transport system substrate-binding protein